MHENMHESSSDLDEHQKWF